MGAGGLEILNLFSPNIRVKVSNFEPHLLLIDTGICDCDSSCTHIGARAKKLSMRVT